MPGVVIRSEYTEVRAVNSMVRLSSPPQAQLAGISGSTNDAHVYCPQLSNTQQPPGAGAVYPALDVNFHAVGNAILCGVHCQRTAGCCSASRPPSTSKARMNLVGADFSLAIFLA